jgi:hypothetical protein
VPATPGVEDGALFLHAKTLNWRVAV